MVREGLRVTPSRRCGNNRQYQAQKDRPEQYTAEQRKGITDAYGSVRRWLHTPVTHITSIQMKRFRNYINDRDKQVSVMKQRAE